MKEINIAFITERMITGHGVDLVVDRLADGVEDPEPKPKLVPGHR